MAPSTEPGASGGRRLTVAPSTEPGATGGRRPIVAPSTEPGATGGRRLTVAAATEPGAPVEPEWSLMGTAQVVGGYVWLEERLFETIGSWVQSEPHPEVKLHLDEDSHHHAWHALLWRERLPVLAGVDPEVLVRPATPGWEAALGEAAAATTSVERLAGLYRALVPRLVAGYQSHRQRALGPSDGPVGRVLGLVLADDVDDWLRGEALLQGLLADGGDVQHAARYQARVESLLVSGRSGGGGRESNPPDGDRPSQPL